MKFCGNCGTSLRAELPEPSAERRQLTVCFVDLVGSTALSESLDPEELRELYGSYQSACAEIISRYDGHVAQYLGDGLLAYFGYPVAREDNAHRAIRSGLDILSRVARLTMQGQRVHVRVGIHTGLVVVGDVGAGERREQLALGEAPNIAARVQGEAETDTLLISEATRRLVGGHFLVEDLGSRTLKGISKPMALFRVLGTSDRATRFEATTTAGLAPFVGRERELETIRDKWAQAVGGRGQTLLLRAEPGMGKSRLLGATKQVADAHGHELFEAQCSPYQIGTSLHPIIELLTRHLGLDGLSVDEKLERLSKFVSDRRVSVDEAVPLLSVLLSLPPTAQYPASSLPPSKQRQRTLDVLADLVTRSPSGVPVLVLVEDVHWADPSTLELLGLLIARQTTSPVLMVCTSRPEGALPGLTGTHCSELAIGALPQQNVRALAAGVVGRKSLPEDVLRQIIARTAGVPLFVEAVTRTIIESGVLRETEDRFELTGPLPAGLIPATVHDSLMARIDRLGADKSVAQLASVIGRSFSFELLQAVTNRDVDGLSRSLERLVDLDLVSQAGVPPYATYMFKHALVQDAAYESLLRKSRQEYHGRIADALLARFPDTGELKPELLARHFEGAGRVSEAIDYWMKAGFQAQQRSAVEECVAHLRKAVSLLETLPDDAPERVQREMNAQLALAPALMATRGWGAREVETACNRARDLCERTQNGQGLLAALWGLWTVLFVRGEHRRALEAAKSVLGMALATDVRILHVAARHGVGFTHFFRGEFPEAREHAEKALELFDLEQEKALVRVFQIPSTVCCLAFLTMSLRLSGYIDEADQRQRELENLVDALANPACTGVGIGVGMYYYLDTRDVDGMARKAEIGYSLSIEEGFAFWSTTMRVYRGWTQAMRGDTKAAIAEMRSGMETFIGTQSGIYVPTMWLMLSDALRVDGQLAAALDAVETGLRIGNEFEENYYRAELLRAKAELQIATGDAASGEATLRQAIEFARGQGARLLELRAALVLARVLANRGQRDEALGLIEPLDEWFTQGRQSPDLVALRDALAALGSSRAVGHLPATA